LRQPLPHQHGRAGAHDRHGHDPHRVRHDPRHRAHVPAGAALPRRPREPGGGLLGVPGRVRALPHGPAPGAGRGLGAAGGRVAGGPRGGARGRQAQVRVPLPRHHARRRQGARAAAGGRGRALAPRRARVHPARGGHAHA
ncbi:hypothetical protein EG859_15320, partial [Enterococcus faecalis]